MTSKLDQNVAVDHLPTREAYDRWAEIYDGEGNPLIAIEEPHVDQLLGDVRGLAIADIGCGTGRHTLRLAQRGAIVTGVDFSAGMLTKAREKFRATDGAAPAAQFLHHNLDLPLPFENDSFDQVVCGLVIDHITNLVGLFSEMRRICRRKPEGSIIISVMHPAMMLRGVQARFTDPATGRETRPESRPHQISDYVTAAVKAGLTIDHISEHSVNDELAARSERARKYLGWPLLMMMRLTPGA